MATKWSKKKVDPESINNGNEYEKGDRVARQSLNAMVESGLYSQAYAEALTDAPDVSEAGNVGTPTVSFVDNVKDGVTYKKFKFANLKGIQGEKGEQGIQGEKGEQGIQGEKGEKGDTGATPNLTVTATIDNSVGTPNVAVSESGTPENPIINLAFTGMKGADGSSPYANTSEGQISGLNLNSSSTLADLATQLLAVQTRVVSAPIGNNITSANATALRRLLGGAPFGGNYERVEFKVFGQVEGLEKLIEAVGFKQSTSNTAIRRGYLVYNDAGESYEWQWTGWQDTGTSAYTNTSEIVDNAITLTSTSRLANLATQILAQKTKAVRAPFDDNLKRILGNLSSATPSNQNILFKVVSTPKDIDINGLPYPKADGLIECYLNAWSGSSPEATPPESELYEWKQLLISYPIDKFTTVWGNSGWTPQFEKSFYPVGSIYITTQSGTPSPVYYFGGTWEQIGKTGIPETTFNTVTANVVLGQETLLQEMTIPANTSAFIFGNVQSNSSIAQVMSCIVRVANASTGAVVNGYTFINRTTNDSGGGVSISFYFPAVNYECKVKLMSYGYGDSNISMNGDFQVVKIPQNQFVWKRIA